MPCFIPWLPLPPTVVVVVKAGGQRPWLVMNIGSAAPVRPARHHKENSMKCACGWHTSSPPASSATTSRSVQHIFHRADFYVHVARRADETAEPIDWCTVARGFETFFCAALVPPFFILHFSLLLPSFTPAPLYGPMMVAKKLCSDNYFIDHLLTFISFGAATRYRHGCFCCSC